MKAMLLIAGALSLGLGAPALAKPGNGHGNPHGNAYGYGNARIYGENERTGYGVGGCPPGLAKKSVACMPPGQARKLSVGQQMPRGFANPYAYNQIPDRLRSRYALNRRNNYYYNNGYLYGVNPRTMVVQQAISALLR